MLIIRYINSFNILVFIAVVFFSILSLLFNSIRLFVVFIVLAAIMSIIFMFFCNVNQKLYFGVNIVLFLLISAFFYITNLGYASIDFTTFIFPILGGLVAVVGFYDGMEKYGLYIEAGLLMGTSKFKEALHILDKNIESGYNGYQVMFLKAAILSILGRHEETLELLNQFIDKRANKTLKLLAMNLKVDTFIHLKRFDEANGLIEGILTKNPENGNALFYKGLLLSKVEHKQESIKYYEDSLEMVDMNLLKFKKSRIKRIRFPEKIWNIEVTELLNNKGFLFYKLHQYDSALECFNEAIETSFRGIENQGFSNALDINSENYLPWANKAYVLAKLEEYDEALKCVDKSLELFSESPYALYCKGYVLAGSRMLWEALKYYQKSIEIDSTNEETYYHKGKAHEKLGQYKEALSCYNKVLELNPYCELSKQAKDHVEQISGN